LGEHLLTEGIEASLGRLGAGPVNSVRDSGRVFIPGQVIEDNQHENLIIIILSVMALMGLCSSNLFVLF
jgi:hypothetical protein